MKTEDDDTKARKVTHGLMWRVSQACGIGGHTAMCDEVFVGVKAALTQRDAMFARWLRLKADQWQSAVARGMAADVDDRSWLEDLAALDGAGKETKPSPPLTPVPRGRHGTCDFCDRCGNDRSKSPCSSFVHFGGGPPPRINCAGCGAPYDSIASSTTKETTNGK